MVRQAPFYPHPWGEETRKKVDHAHSATIMDVGSFSVIISLSNILLELTRPTHNAETSFGLWEWRRILGIRAG
jgi:hypothetical protein